VELPVRRMAVARLEAAALTRGREAEAVQKDATQQSAGANEGGGSRMDMRGGSMTKGDTRWRWHGKMQHDNQPVNKRQGG
jgi:hypothetical protein